MLANYAEVRDGLLYVLGAGWTNYTVSALPADIVGQVILILDVDDASNGVNAVLTVDVVDPKGSTVLHDQVPVEFTSTDAVIRIPVVYGLQAHVSDAGVHEVSASLGGTEIVRLPFEVRLP